MDRWCTDGRYSDPYGGLREKRFLLPFWEKCRVGAKTPPNINSVNLTEAFNTNISPI